jgi:ParB-like chromosome segregation protein Spo0J
MAGTPFHPVAELFPLMTGDAFDEFVRDIRVHGLREPIWRHEGKIIDGRNRYNACLEGGVQPRYREWDGEGDLTEFVVSLNLHRRHLTESQRSMVAAKLSNKPVGGAEYSSKKTVSEFEHRSVSREDAAKLLNVGKTSVSTAKKVLAKGAPEVVAAVESGRASVHIAERVIDLPKDDQPAALDHELAQKGKRNREDFEPEANGDGTAPKVRGIGVIRANEAINCLTRIPKNDALRERGFQLVKDWIRKNK